MRLDPVALPLHPCASFASSSWFDVLGLLGLVWFFLDGLRYPSSGGDYIGTWVPLLLVPATMLAGALALNARGHTKVANALLGVLAAPLVLYGLFVLLIVVTQPSFR